jgi:hypothetical protein
MKLSVDELYRDPRGRRDHAARGDRVLRLQMGMGRDHFAAARSSADRPTVASRCNFSDMSRR